MRKIVASVSGIRVLAMVMITGFLVSGPAVFGDPPDKTSKPATNPAKDAAAQTKPAKPDIPTLDEMLAQALKDNPDIRVGEAKIREAEAELNRTRLLVTQKVFAFRQSWEHQRALADLAEKEWKRCQNLHSSGALPRETLDEVQAKLAAAKAALAQIEAEMPYLLGKPHQSQGAATTISTNNPVFFEIVQPGKTFP